MLTLGGDGGSGKDQSKGSSDGKGPSDTTITPGPVPSGTYYSQRPGGRGDSGTGGSGGVANDHGDVSGSGGSGGGTGGSGAGGSGGSGGGNGALGTGDGKAVPANSSLPDCTSGSVRLAVRSVKDSYGPDEKPKFEIVVKNSGSKACKVDFGSAAATLTITATGGDDHIWSSGDCPRGKGPVLIELPGSGETKRTLEWNRERSAPQCGTPSGGGAVGDGTYRVEVKIAGVTEKYEFTLNKG